jgi:hypothetical protein
MPGPFMTSGLEASDSEQSRLSHGRQQITYLVAGAVRHGLNSGSLKAQIYVFIRYQYLLCTTCKHNRCDTYLLATDQETI